MSDSADCRRVERRIQLCEWTLQYHRRLRTWTGDHRPVRIAGDGTWHKAHGLIRDKRIADLVSLIEAADSAADAAAAIDAAGYRVHGQERDRRGRPSTP